MRHLTVVQDHQDSVGQIQSEIVKSPLMPILEKYKTDLSATLLGLQSGSKIDQWTKLLPIKILDDLHDEISSSLSSSSRASATKWATLLIEAYPARQTNNPQTYIRSMSYDLSEYPEDIIEQTVHEVRRSCKFLPTCAEVYQHAAKLMSERKAILDVIKKQKDEHKRRQDELSSEKPKGWKDATQDQRNALQDLIKNTIKKLSSD